MGRVLFLTVFAVTTTLSQSTSSRSVLEKDFSSFIKLTTRSFTAPTRWESSDWLIAGGVVGGTFASGWLDDELYRIAENNRSARNDDIEKVFEGFSKGITGIGISGVMYGSGLAFENDWLRETGLLMGSALIVSATTQSVLKLLLGRARPYVGVGSGVFKPFTFEAGYVSFPSGHTVVAFTISTVLSRRIDNLYATIGLHTAATLSGVSRIYSRNHWLSDIVFGGALAFIVSNSVVTWYENGMMDDDGGTGLRVVPQMNGVTVVWKF